jgi:hypothetical protein
MNKYKIIFTIDRKNLEIFNFIIYSIKMNDYNNKLSE